MTSLQLLVESILSDLVDARAQADMHAAELAEEYRKHRCFDHSVCRHSTFQMPQSNSGLRLLAKPTRMINRQRKNRSRPLSNPPKAAAAKIMELRSVATRVTTDRSRRELDGLLNQSIVNTMVEYIDRESAERRRAVENAIRTALARYQVTRLTTADNDALLQLVQAIDDALEGVPKRKRRLPRLVVAGEALSEIDQSAVSTIRFDVDLTERHWTALEDGEGGETDRLTEG